MFDLVGELMVIYHPIKFDQNRIVNSIARASGEVSELYLSQSAYGLAHIASRDLTCFTNLCHE